MVQTHDHVVSSRSDAERLLKLMKQNRELREEASCAADDTARQANAAMIQRLENEILAIMDGYLRQELKPHLVSKFKTQSRVLSYTSQAQEFFRKVVEHRPKEFWYAESEDDLRYWVSRVLTNQMLNVLRRDQKGKAIRDEFVHYYQQCNQTLGTFVYESHRVHLSDPRSIFVFETIEHWHASNDCDRQQMARAITDHFIGGLSRGEIATELDVTPGRVKYLIEQGLNQLIRQFRDASDRS